MEVSGQINASASLPQVAIG